MKFNYTLVLTSLLAFSATSVSAKGAQECKYALKNLSELLKFPTITPPNRLGRIPSYDETAQTLDQLNKDLLEIAGGISSKCAELSKDMKEDQYFKLGYQKSLESAKNVYINIWGSSKAINSDPKLKESTLSVVKSLDDMLDFVYHWPGTLKDNNYKRLTNDLIVLRKNTKEALQ